MEQVAIRFDARNIVTICICAALGYAVLWGVSIAYKRTMAMKAGGAA